MNQLDIFGGEKAHEEVAREKKEQDWRDRVKADPEFARRNLILGALNRRGNMDAERIAALLGFTISNVDVDLYRLRKKGLVVEVGRRQWRATARREE